MTDLAPSLLIEFSPPLSWNNQSVDAIELHEPRACDVIKAQAELTGKPEAVLKFGVALICAVTDKPRTIVEQMPMSKLMEAINYLTGFLQDGPAIGENSLPI